MTAFYDIFDVDDSNCLFLILLDTVPPDHWRGTIEYILISNFLNSDIATGLSEIELNPLFSNGKIRAGRNVETSTMSLWPLLNNKVKCIDSNFEHLPRFLLSQYFQGQELYLNKMMRTFTNTSDLLWLATYCIFDACFDCLKEGSRGFFGSLVFVKDVDLGCFIAT